MEAIDSDELRRIKTHMDQIIKESHNKGDVRAVDYFAHTSNKATGASSLRPAKQTSDLSTGHYYWHGLTGQGRDLQTNIADLSINKELLKQSFLGV